MKLRHLLILLFIASFLTACSQKSEPQTVEVKKYIATLQAMKFDELKNELKKDTTLLKKLIKTSTFTLQLTSHFSSGEKSAVSQSVPEFKLNTNKEKVTALFNDYANRLYFDQDFTDNATEDSFNLYGQNKFTFKSRYNLTEDNHVLADKDSLFKAYEEKVETDGKIYFFNGKKIAKADIGLKRIDSIQAEVSLKLATDFEKFSIAKTDKTISYKDFTIQIESIKENLAQLKIPVALYSDIVGYQAYNNSGFRMDTQALSTTPVLSVHKIVKDNLQELLEIFIAVLQENDEQKGKTKLNQLKQNHLNAKVNMTEFDASLNKLVEDKAKVKELGDLGLYNEIASMGKKVIDAKTQFIFVEFPDDVKTIDIFVGTDLVSLQNKKMVKFGNHYLSPKYFDESKPNIVYYSIEHDKKFGISNRDGETIIKPAYDELRQLANEYFMGDQKLYWLNVADKKMIALPQYKNFVQSIKPGYDVFEKSVGGDDKMGVVLNREKVIIPFDYYQFEKHDHFIIASKPNLDELYDLNFKKIPNKGIQKINTIDKFISSTIKYPTIFAGENSNKKKALVDKNLKLLTPFKYEFINPFFEINNYYIAGIRTADGSNYSYGIIDMTGKEVVPFIFCNISEEFDKNGKLKFCLKDKSQTMDFKSFLQKYKK